MLLMHMGMYGCGKNKTGMLEVLRCRCWTVCMLLTLCFCFSFCVSASGCNQHFKDSGLKGGCAMVSFSMRACNGLKPQQHSVGVG